MNKQSALEKIIVKSYLLDICLENTPQILVQVVVVVMAASRHRLDWLTGVEGVFDYHDSSSQLGTVLFYFSIGWSLRSIHSGLFSTFLYRKDYSVGDLGKVIMYLIILVGSTMRIFGVILALTPFLGLFDLMMFYQQDTKFSYSPQVWQLYNSTLADSARLDWYTGGLDLETVLLCLALFPLVHVVGVNCLRLVHHESLRRRLGPRLLFNLSLNSFTTLIIPSVYRDWDEHRLAEPSLYHRRWTAVRLEYLSMVLFYLAENIVLCGSVCLASWRNLTRGWAIPRLSEEDHVMWISGFFVSTPILFVLGAMIEMKLFVYFNEKAHPWSIIFKGLAAEAKKTNENQTV